MIEFDTVSKSFGPQVIFNAASLRVNSGERVGIVGPNGTGKSTLFELVCGQDEPDKGEVMIPKNARLGYLRQQLNAQEESGSVLDYTLSGLPHLNELEARIEQIESRLAQPAAENRERLLKQLGEVQDQFEHAGGYQIKSKAQAALSGLGFGEEAQGRAFSTFSGGWQMRAELARTLISGPEILLLDEPSNYLDLPAVEWLQRFLRDYPGTLLLISHDRFLLESLTTVTVEVYSGQLTRYEGDYSYYVTQRDARIHQLSAAKKNQDRKRAEIERFVERFRSKNTKASQVQSRIKALEKMEVIEVPETAPTHSKLRLPPPPKCGAEIVRLEDAGFGYEPGQWILKGIDLRITAGQKIALVGYNGMGKTTLLRLLAGQREATEGKRVLGHNVVIGYQSQEFADTLPPDKTVFDIVHNASPEELKPKVRTMLGSFGFSGDDIMKPCRVLSGGEKIRLAFAKIFVNPPNCLLLDEPTTHLDLAGRQALEQLLKEYPGTVCLVSHDIMFVRNVATSIIAMTSPGITSYHGDYEYYREKAAPDQVYSAVKSEPGKPVMDKKAERKARAEQRKAASKEKRQHEKKMKEAESIIVQLEEEQKILLEKMGQTEFADFEAANKRLAEIQEGLKWHNRTWEQSAMALEELS